MSKHTPGPWYVGKTIDSDCRIYSPAGTHAIARTYGPDLNGIGVCRLTGPENRADARRIVACVNACEGISTEAIEVISKMGGVQHKMPVTAALVAQRDELLLALERIAEIDSYNVQNVGDSSPHLVFGACGDIAMQAITKAIRGTT
jgi:hypothetical protein